MPVHKNVVILLFDTFQVRAFFFIQSHKGYQFERLDSEILPQTWNKDIQTRNKLVVDLCQSFIHTLGLGRQEVFFHFVVSDSSYKQISMPYPFEVHILTKKDHALVPYFASSYLDADYVIYNNLCYYEANCVDNKNNQWDKNWHTWKELADMIKNSGFDSATMINTWLNYLIRPVMYTKNMYTPLTLSLLFQSLPFTQTYAQSIAIAGGEGFSWLTNDADILYPYVVGCDEPGTFRQIYHDRQNVLMANSILKTYSLAMLESCMGQFVSHIGDILTIGAKKPVKAGSIIGKVIVHDDTGYKTLYPLVDDILTIKLTGIAKVSVDLHYPFYMLQNIVYKARDILVIDTRIHDKKNVLNMPAWYTRLHEYDIY